MWGPQFHGAIFNHSHRGHHCASARAVNPTGGPVWGQILFEFAFVFLMRFRQVAMCGTLAAHLLPLVYWWVKHCFEFAAVFLKIWVLARHAVSASCNVWYPSGTFCVITLKTWMDKLRQVVQVYVTQLKIIRNSHSGIFVIFFLVGQLKKSAEPDCSLTATSYRSLPHCESIDKQDH